MQYYVNECSERKKKWVAVKQCNIRHPYNMRVVEIFDRTKVILEITFLCSLRSLGEPVHELDMHTHKYSSTFRLPSAP